MTSSLRSFQSAPSNELLHNGSFRDWVEEKPAGWSTGAGLYIRDTEMAGHSPQALRLTPLPPKEGAPKAPLTIHQTATLQPDTEYTFTNRAAQEGSGTTLIRIQAVENGRPTGPALLEWNNGWSSGHPWQPLTLTFRTDSRSEYRLTIIHHTTPGNSLWLEELSLRPTAAQRRDAANAAATLFTQSIMLPLGKDARAQASPSELFVRGCRGEFEPALLGLTALTTLEDAELKLEGELTGPEGKSIAPEAVSIRTVATEGLLPPSRPRHVPKGEDAGWWITVRLPDSATPGRYKGVLQLTAGGQTIGRLPLVAEVEPFLLPQPDIAMFVYHNERYFPKGGFLTAEQRAAYYRDMKEHGMNTVTVYNNPDIDGSTIDLDHDRSWLISQKRIDEMNKGGYLLDAEEVKERFQFGLKPVMELISKSGLVAEGQPVLLLAHKAGIYNWGGLPSEALKATMEQWLARKDWPKPLYYVNDEVEGHPDRIAAAQQVFERIKQLNIPLTTVSANIAVKELGHDYNVWVQLEKRVTPEMAALAREYNAQLWTYNCNISTENTQLTRALFGLWAYRSGVNGVGLWAYYDSKNWYADADGTIHGTNGRSSLSRICPSPEGPIPTVSWETTREGVKDYRYAKLFDALLAQLRQKTATLGPDAGATARGQELLLLLAGAEHARKSLIGSIPFDAMAALASNPYGAATAEFIPVLGMGDPRLVSEQKRAGLSSYIRRISKALEKE